MDTVAAALRAWNWLRRSDKAMSGEFGAEN
jgi:hypothetical protein